jgi:hypothetical protein
VLEVIACDNSTEGVPVVGLYFSAGDPTTSGLTYNGTVVRSAAFSFCDTLGHCTTPVVMRKNTMNDGFYLPGTISAKIPMLSYSSLGITSSSQFYNGNPNPIKVVLCSDSFGTTSISNPIFIKISGGGYISDTVLSSLTLPSITNAATLLNASSGVTKPTINYTVPTGFLVSSVNSLHGAGTSITTTAITSTTQMILSTTDGSVTLQNDTFPGNNTYYYRGLQFTTYTSGGLLPVTIKYVASSDLGSF